MYGPIATWASGAGYGYRAAPNSQNAVFRTVTVRGKGLQHGGTVALLDATVSARSDP